jgi:hypothetical protein
METTIDILKRIERELQNRVDTITANPRERCGYQGALDIVRVEITFAGLDADINALNEINF